MFKEELSRLAKRRASASKHCELLLEAEAVISSLSPLQLFEMFSKMFSMTSEKASSQHYFYFEEMIFLTRSDFFNSR